MSSQLQAAVEDPTEAIKMVTAGLQWPDAQELAEWLEVSVSQLGNLLQISPATMTRRRKGRFDPAESDRIVRFARLWLLACDAVGGPAGARSWLKRPQYGLRGAVPLDVARSEVGAREVESLLRRILYGVLA